VKLGSDGKVPSIFEGLSQHVDVDLTRLRLIEDRVLVKDLGDVDQIGSIFVPENVDHMRGLGHQGNWRLGQVVAIGPGRTYHEWNGNEFGGWKRRLYTKPCEACEGHGRFFDMKDYEYRRCPKCKGDKVVAVCDPPQCAVGDRVIFERRKECDVYINRELHCLVYAGQSILGVVEAE
jgi:co-chaperonin GroES (HSP10)